MGHPPFKKSQPLRAAGETPALQQGQPGENQPNDGQQDGRGGQRGGERGGNRGGLTPNAGGRQGGVDYGGGYAAGAPLSTDDLRRFFEGDYRRWTDAMRNAEALLPDDNQSRGRISDIRTRIDTLRRAYLRDRALPTGETFTEQVTAPLALTADELEKEIARKLNDQEFDLSGEAAVPAQYSDRVAEYFKALAEQEKK